MDEKGVPYLDRHKIFPMAITKHGRDIRKKMHQLGKAAKVLVKGTWYYWNYFGFPLSGFEGLIHGVVQKIAGADRWMCGVEWTVSVACAIQNDKYRPEIAEILFHGDTASLTYWLPALYEVHGPSGDVEHTLVFSGASERESESETIERKLRWAKIHEVHQGLFPEVAERRIKGVLDPDDAWKEMTRKDIKPPPLRVAGELSSNRTGNKSRDADTGPEPGVKEHTPKDSPRLEQVLPKRDVFQGPLGFLPDRLPLVQRLMRSTTLRPPSRTSTVLPSQSWSAVNVPTKRQSDPIEPETKRFKAEPISPVRYTNVLPNDDQKVVMLEASKTSLEQKSQALEKDIMRVRILRGRYKEEAIEARTNLESKAEEIRSLTDSINEKRQYTESLEQDLSDARAEIGAYQERDVRVNDTMHDLLEVNRSALTVLMDLLELNHENTTSRRIKSNVVGTLSQLESIYGDAGRYLVPLPGVAKYQGWIPAEECLDVTTIIESRNQEHEKLVVFPAKLDITRYFKANTPTAQLAITEREAANNAGDYDSTEEAQPAAGEEGRMLPPSRRRN